MLVGGELVTGGANLVEQFCALKGAQCHCQHRRLADRETDHAGRDRWRYHDLAALLADQAGRDHRVFRTDVLPRMAGGRGREMHQVRMRQRCRFISLPAAWAFHENLAGAVDDDFGQGVICQIRSQRLEITRQHEPAAIAFD